MNKKFSTLVASLLLASTVGTVAAQEPVFTKSALPSWEQVASVADGRCYQLSNGNQVLIMQKVSTDKGDRFVLKYVPYYLANLGESLWYVKAVKDNNENGVAFKFMNLAYNYPISFDPSKAQDYKAGNFEASYLSGNATEWAWMRSETGVGLNVAKTPEAYFKKDSVMTMVPLKNGDVAAVKYDVTEMDKVTALNVRPVAAGPVWLNKWDLNGMLQTQDQDKTSLAFSKDVTEGLTNLLCGDDHGNKYEAVDPAGKNTLSFGAVADADKAQKEAHDSWKAEEKKWNDLIAEQEKVNGDKAAYNKQISDLNAEVGRKITERTGVSSKIEGLESELEVLNDAKSALESELTTASGLSEKAKGELTQKLIAKNAAQANVDIKESAIKDAEGAYTEATELLTQYKTTHSNAVIIANGAKEEADALTAIQVFLATSADYQTMAGKRLKASEAYKTLGELGRSVVEKLIVAIEEDAKTGNKQNNSEAAKKVVADFVAPYSEALVQADAAVAEAKTAVENQSKVVEDLKDDIAALKGELTALQEALEAAINEWNTAVNNADDKEGEVQRIQGLIADKEKEVKAKLDELIAENVILAGLNTDIAALNTQIEEIQEKLDTEIAEELSELDILIAQAAENTAVAAQNYQRLYFVYSNLNAAKTPYWLSLKTGDDKYLMVDTCYLTGDAGEEIAGMQNLRFAVAKHAEDFVSTETLAARDVNGRFNFRFLYFPTQDSLRIEADGFNKKNVTTKFWKDRTNNEIDLYASSIPGKEQNLVKVAVLGGARREVTIGSSENLKGTDVYTINDRIGLNLAPASHPVTLPAGLYYMDVVNTTDSQKNGARLMQDLDGWSLTKVAPVEWDVMDFEHMPAAKWAVTATPNEFGGYPEIVNLETGEILNNGSYKVLKNTAEETVITIDYYYTNDGWWNARKETFKLTKANSGTQGYYNENPKNVTFTLDYLNLNPGLSISIGNSTVGKDTVLRVSSDATKFELVKIDEYAYSPVDETLKAGFYTIRVNDPYKLANNHKYVRVSDVDGTELVTVSKENASVFRLKEVNCVEGVHYFALLTNNSDGVFTKAGVIDATGLIKAENVKSETTTAAFALTADTVVLYREFTPEELANDGKMNFYRVNSTEKAYLYEGANNLLCVEGKGDNKKDDMTVISTGVEETIMPQYFVAKDVNYIKGDTVWCNATAAHTHATLADSLACTHTVITMDTIKGRFLVNMIDSVPAVAKYTWENKYQRLAFLPGYITDGNLTIIGTTKKVALAENKHDATKFAFRLVEEGSNDFLIESESHNKTAFDGGIAPIENGGWVKIQNGVPVIINGSFEAAAQSDLFNVDIDESATSNGVITTSVISIVAGNGNVQIAGAQGKKVVISNVLGQVIANTVITSDNATIATPAGVVVVAVEGEAAEKAIVK